MNIYIHNRQQVASINEDTARHVVREVLAQEGITADEVSLSFVTEEEISDLHARYFNDPTPTDCISFPCDSEEEKYRVLGDVIVCPTVALTYAKDHNISPEEELLRYMIHGLLHLIGYDDIEEKDYLAMKGLENRYLEHFMKQSQKMPPLGRFDSR